MINYPLTFPQVKINGFTLGAVSNNEVNFAMDTAAQRVYKRLGEFTKISITMPLLNEDDARTMSAFIFALKGRSGTFKFKCPTSPTKNSNVANKTITAHNDIRSELTLNNVTGLSVGDKVRVGNQMVMITQIVNNTVDIFPALRTNSINSTVYCSDVWGIYRLTQDENLFTMGANRFTSYSFDAIEAY